MFIWANEKQYLNQISTDTLMLYLNNNEKKILLDLKHAKN